MKKKQLARHLHAYRKSNIEAIIELRKAYDSLKDLKDEDEVPDELEEELHYVALLIDDPLTPQYPLSWKEFIPESLETDLNAILVNFKEGDLIYGLSSSATSLMRFLERNGRDDFANSENEPVINPFIDTLLDPRSNPANRFYAPARDFQSYAHILKPELADYVPITYAPDVPFIKKMSKMGVFWILNSDYKIHFVLNKIDYKMCFEKKFDKITFAELRFLFRYWEQFKPYYERGQINFYFQKDAQLIKVKAPWESKPEIVGTYKPKHTYKESHNPFFNSFIIHLIKTEIENAKWRTGLGGLGGGVSINFEGEAITVPHRVAKIYNLIINDPLTNRTAVYLKIKQLAREAIENPKWLQQTETREFYQAILDFDKKRPEQREETFRFFKGQSRSKNSPEVDEEVEQKPGVFSK